MKMTRFDIFTKVPYHIDNIIDKNYPIIDNPDIKNNTDTFEEAILSISKKRDFLSYSIVEAIRRSGKLKNFIKEERVEEGGLINNETMKKLPLFSVFKNIR
jgi:hypothetical protein